MTVTIIATCGQVLCTADATHSFVWPGAERKCICDVHLETLKTIATALKLSLESLDIQPIGAPGVVVSPDQWRIPNAGGLDDPRRLLRVFASGTRVRAVRTIFYITEGGEVAEGSLGVVRREKIVQGARAVVPVLWDCLTEPRDTFVDSIDEVPS